MSQKSDSKELKPLQLELKKAQQDLKVAELQEKRETEIRRLDWEKEKFKLQLEHDKERWAFDSKAQELRLSYSESQRMTEALQSCKNIVNDLRERLGGLTAQVTIYKPFFDKYIEEHKSETS